MSKFANSSASPAVLPVAFYAPDACTVAQALLGQVLVHDTGEGRCAGVIVETEAYDESDPASHSFRGRTKRNAVMFGPGGRAYVYRSYGIHWCLNVACGPEGFGAAVLLRALELTAGVPLAMARRGNPRGRRGAASGPGCLTQALGIGGAHDGLSLTSGPLRLIAGPDADLAIASTPRIGISRATDRLWRFTVRGHPCVSGRAGS